MRFGTSDRLDIAYFECTKWSERFNHHFNYVSHNEVCIISQIFEKRAENVALGRFLEFGCSEPKQNDSVNIRRI